MRKVNLWKVEGYAGYYDCDGPSDYNINETIIIDATFSKQAVVDLMARCYRKNRVLEIKVNLLKEMEVDIEQ